MPTLNEAWRAICRFVTRTNTPFTIDLDTERTDGVHWSNGTADAAQPGNGGLHGFYERVKEQVLESQRSSKLDAQEVIRKNRRAKRRALSLLMGLLNQEQRQEFRTFRHFHVIGGNSRNCYRIRAAAFANIDVLCPNGRVRHRLCAHPAGDVPVYDVMAAQLLHLQDPVTEQRFLQRANVHPALSEERVRSRATWIA